MMRPQFGSPPCQLVFTSALFATARAAASASWTVLAPVTRTVTTRCNSFAIAHDHFCEFEADMIQSGLKKRVNCES